jgi:hypothetical protein
MTNEATHETMKCPYCAEQITVGAKKCKHCGEFIDPAMREIENLKNQKQNVFMNAGGGGGGGGGSSSSSASSAAGGFITRMSCLDWILTLLTGGLWLIVVALRG